MQVVPNALEGFVVHDVDDTEATKYYGYVSCRGDYYIMCEDTAAKTYRFWHGKGVYATDWAARAVKAYDLLNEVWPS